MPMLNCLQYAIENRRYYVKVTSENAEEVLKKEFRVVLWGGTEVSIQLANVQCLTGFLGRLLQGAIFLRDLTSVNQLGSLYGEMEKKLQGKMW